MRIAVVGSGISGLLCALELTHGHEVELFEAAGQLGGHAMTLDVALDGRSHPVDVGFIVYNQVTYPILTGLFDRLGVRTRESDMSFSVSDAESGLEYAGTSLDTLFAQRRNLLRPSFLRMLKEILRFNRTAPSWAARQPDRPLQELLRDGDFSRGFRNHYLLPMAAAIWSSSPRQILAMPAGFFVRFFSNHGFLTTNSHHTWRTVVGGSRCYVAAIAERLRGRIHLGCAIHRLWREHGGVALEIEGRGCQRFDQAVLATHSNQALALLADATPDERSVLSAIRYARNHAVLHTDVSLLPRTLKARASWNYHVTHREDHARVTYDLSRLQGLATRQPLLLSLNCAGSVEPTRILETLTFEHPQLDVAAVAAQGRWREISGRNRVHFCGAYWRNGFHEDGAHSAVRVVRALCDSREAAA